MNNFKCRLLASVTGLLLMPVAAMAQGWIVTVDELGNGSYTTNDATTYFTGVMGADPSGGFTSGNVLIYTLPFNFNQTGDYWLTNSLEPLPLTTGSDIVRFWGVNQVIFYSDTNGVDVADLADAGLPTSLLTPNMGLLETGTEGNLQGATYQTSSGNPGFAGLVGGQGITYNFISDVPEPSVLALAGTGLAGLTWWIRRQRRR
jgi:hypothetical protein